jgi:hypothetical protein
VDLGAHGIEDWGKRGPNDDIYALAGLGDMVEYRRADLRKRCELLADALKQKQFWPKNSNMQIFLHSQAAVLADAIWNEPDEPLANSSNSQGDEPPHRRPPALGQPARGKGAAGVSAAAGSTPSEELLQPALGTRALEQATASLSEVAGSTPSEEFVKPAFGQPALGDGMAGVSEVAGSTGSTPLEKFQPALPPHVVAGTGAAGVPAELLKPALPRQAVSDILAVAAGKGVALRNLDHVEPTVPAEKPAELLMAHHAQVFPMSGLDLAPTASEMDPEEDQQRYKSVHDLPDWKTDFGDDELPQFPEEVPSLAPDCRPWMRNEPVEDEEPNWDPDEVDDEHRNIPLDPLMEKFSTPSLLGWGQRLASYLKLPEEKLYVFVPLVQAQFGFDAAVYDDVYLQMVMQAQLQQAHTPDSSLPPLSVTQIFNISLIMRRCYKNLIQTRANVLRLEQEKHKFRDEELENYCLTESDLRQYMKRLRKGFNESPVQQKFAAEDKGHNLDGWGLLYGEDFIIWQ